MNDEVMRLRSIIDDLRGRVRSIEDRLPPTAPPASTTEDAFRVGDFVYHVNDGPHVLGEVVAFVELANGQHFRVRVLDPDAKWQQQYWPVASCRAAPPALVALARKAHVRAADPLRVIGGSGPWVPPAPLAAPEVENLCADAHEREEVLVALVRRAAEEIRDRETKKNLLADLEALLAEDS